MEELEFEEPQDVSKSFTVNTSRYVSYAFSYLSECSYDCSLSKLHYIGPNEAKVFCDYLENDTQSIYHNHLKHVKPMLHLLNKN